MLSPQQFPTWLIRFAKLQALSCIFPFTLIAVLALTKQFSIPGLPRYDLILVAGLLIQVFMFVARLETKDEVKVICVFHALGLALETFKKSVGSWSYPDCAYTKVGDVPLYSGFMYASVASYMCQAWRRLKLEITGWPLQWVVVLLSSAVYINFFTNRFLPDIRWPMVGLILIAFRRTRVSYTVTNAPQSMPLPMSFFLIGLFVYFAENIATRLCAWQYPHQAEGWQPVHWQKLGSWALLTIVSFIVVATLKRVKQDLPVHQGESKALG